jgi:hypothetical protein
MFTLLVLFLCTILHEGMIIAYTIAVSDRKKYYAALFSALIAPIQFITMLIVVESPAKIAGLITIAIACGVSTIGVISLMDKLDLKKKLKTKKRRPK